jgi:diguanylate cyclase (GGDEF)-like protein
VRALTRQLDSLVRRGGDEFALALPVTTLDQARAVAERVRDCVAANPFEVAGHAIRLTVSIGVAAWDGCESAETLEQRADRALYAAKTGGRDRVAVDSAVLSDDAGTPARDIG